MPERNQFIFIIRGRTGSGKTSLLNKISKELKFRSIIVDEIAKGIPKNIPKRTSTILEKAGGKANKLLRQGQNIVVEGAFLDKKHLKRFLRMIEEIEKYKIKYILLECSPEIAMSRKTKLSSKIIQHQFNKRLDWLENELIFNTEEMPTDEIFDRIKIQPINFKQNPEVSRQKRELQGRQKVAVSQRDEPRPEKSGREPSFHFLLH